MNIIVTGANGQLGNEFREIAAINKTLNFSFFNSKELDITDEDTVNQIFASLDPDVCFNCAAYTAVDKAETETEAAMKVNVSGPILLAKACRTQNAILFHYSSDYVYHLHKKEALSEVDETNPQGVYAASKLEGEQKLIEIIEQYIIIRTSWVYSSFGNNFVKTMIRLGKERDTLQIVSDQIGTPTYARDIAEASMEILDNLIAQSEHTHWGIYNFSNEGVTNWCEFAQTIFELANIDCKTLPITTEQFGAPAPRPKWSVLNKEKIKSTFKLEIPHWKESLKECINILS